MALAVGCCAMTLQAAPFAETFRFTQPDGTQIEVWGEGDEFRAIFEHQGYAVVMNPATRTYTYARLSADGTALIPTRLVVGRDDPAVNGLPQHLRITPEAERAQARARFEKWDAGMELTQRWQARKQAMQLTEQQARDGVTPLSPPTYTTTGTRVGLTLLIDFPDVAGSVPVADIVDYLNGDAYAGYNNNGSVKKYFADVSNNLLTYTNVVVAYIRMANPKTYYDDPTTNAGAQANILIRDALNILKAQANYETEILPKFATLSVDGANRVLACNVFYAGTRASGWSMGLWPHSWSLYTVGAQALSAGGKQVFYYQITDIGNQLTLATFCHENGHMLCDYPDLYDYDDDSVGGAGNFCLMGGAGGSQFNPVQFCAYLKNASGWTETIDLQLAGSSVLTLVAPAGQAGFNRIYRYQNPLIPTEYYLFENRQQSLRDAYIPGAGIAIWHIDELGDRDVQSHAYNESNFNYECTLVCADNLWHMHNNVNLGDANDLYFQGNTSAGYVNKFNDTSEPSARWWDGTLSELDILMFSVKGAEMTFVYGGQPEILTQPVLPQGWVGTPYAFTLRASATPPLVWAIVAGELPIGLTLDGASGILSGLPEQATNANFTVRVEAQSGLADTNEFSLLINAAPTVPFSENFESSAGAIPGGWTQEYVTNSASWDYVNGNGINSFPPTAYNGFFNARFMSGVNTTTYGSKTRLVSPRIVFAGATTNAQLSFMHYMMKRLDLFQDQLRVYYKTVYTDDWNLLATYTQATGVWTKRTLALPGPAAAYYIAFEGLAKDGYGVHLDDIEMLEVIPPQFSFVTPTALPNAIVAQPYTYSFIATNGTPPYTFNWVSGSLPTGLVFTNGVVSGTATAEGSGTFTVALVDDVARSTSSVFTVNAVLPRVELFVQNFENGGNRPAGWQQLYVTNQLDWAFQSGGGNGDTVHQPTNAYEGAFNAVLWQASTNTSITRLITSAINLGMAPVDPRLTFWHYMKVFNGAQDALRVYYKATPNAGWTLLASYTNNVSTWTQQTLVLPEPGTNYTLAFEGVAQYGHGVCLDDMRITVASLAPVITTLSPLPAATVGQAYSQTLTAMGGSAPYTWGVISGTMPAGLTLSSAGVLSGTPTAKIQATLGIRVADVNGFAATNTFALNVINIHRIPYVQNFETMTTTLPLGWSEETNGLPRSWIYRNGTVFGGGTPLKPSQAYQGTNNAVFGVLFNSTTTHKTKLITPTLDLGILTTNAQLSFRLCMAPYNGNQDQLKIFYKTNDSDVVWTQLAAFTTAITSWTNVILALPAPSANYVIAFEGFANKGFGVCIDDVQVTGTWSGGLSAYEQWRESVFGTEVDNPLAADTADWDSDGIPNWLEYAYGMDPLVAGVIGRPIGGVMDGYLTWKYRESKAATDVLYTVEACTSMVNQAWSSAGVVEVSREDSNTWWQVMTRHSVPITNAPQRFLQLKIELPSAGLP